MQEKDEKVGAIKDAISSYPDFPKKGVIFRDIFPVLKNPTLFHNLIDLFEEEIKENKVSCDIVVGIESRGFLLAAPLALRLGVPFIPVRKSGKLPGPVKKQKFDLEYGTDEVEVQFGSVFAGSKVVIVDDLLATGGTMRATIQLMESLSAKVELCLILMELHDLKGREILHTKVRTFLKF